MSSQDPVECISSSDLQLDYQVTERFNMKDGLDSSNNSVPDEFSDNNDEVDVKSTQRRSIAGSRYDRIHTEPNKPIPQTTKNRNKNSKIVKQRSQIKGGPKSFISPQSKIMVKTVPLFFSSATEADDSVNMGESVYTQISKEMFKKNIDNKSTEVYNSLTNDNVLKNAVEKRMPRKRSPNVVQRLYSPAMGEVAEKDMSFRQLQASQQLNKAESFHTCGNKSYLSHGKTSSEKDKMQDYRSNANHGLQYNSFTTFQRDLGKQRKPDYKKNAKKVHDLSITKSFFADSQFLKNPNFSQKSLKKVKERTSSSQSRFTNFYNRQMVHYDSRQSSIKRAIDKKDKYIEDLRRQRDRFTLLSSGSRRILNNSKKRMSKDRELCHLDSNHARSHIDGKFTLPYFYLNQLYSSKNLINLGLAKNSIENNSTCTLEKISNHTVHDRLFQERSVERSHQNDNKDRAHILIDS